MERFDCRIINIRDISTEFPYGLRYSLKDACLEESIAKMGLIHPVVVTSDSPNVLVSGHKRFSAVQAAGRQKVEALVITEKMTPADLFFASVFSNWNQCWPEMDRALAVKKAAATFQLSREEIQGMILPGLGLSAGLYVLDAYLKIWELDAALLDLIASGILPFRGAHVLSRLKNSDQREFAAASSKIKFTSNEMRMAGQWIHDLLKTSGSGLGPWIEQNKLDRILNHPSWDRRMKTEKFMRRLRELRFPKICDYEKNFEAMARQILQGERDLKLEAPKSFEDEGFWIHAKARNPESLSRVLNRLKSQSDLLNSLFDFML